ncbi:MAG: hypothetical protein ACOYMN_08205, partial [Roseimicrobium sp.]
MTKKALLITVPILAVLVGAAGFAGHAWLNGRLQKESLIEQMERAWNCRAQLDDTSVRLLASPASVRLHGLKLAPRDAQNALPLAQRAPLTAETAALSIDQAVLSVKLTDLIAGHLNVEKLQLDGVSAHTVIDVDGNSSIEELFSSPTPVEKPTPSAEVPSVSEIPPPTQAASPPVATESLVTAPQQPANAQPTPAITNPSSGPIQTPAVAAENRRLKANEMVLSLAVEEASMSNGQIRVSDLRSGTLMTMEGVSVALRDIDVNPADLAVHNRCRFAFGGLFRVENTSEKIQIANFSVEGSGDAKPFDSTTGEWRPDLHLDVTIKKGGLLGGALLAQQVGAKDLERLKEWGVDLGDL